MSISSNAKSLGVSGTHFYGPDAVNDKVLMENKIIDQPEKIKHLHHFSSSDTGVHITSY